MTEESQPRQTLGPFLAALALIVVLVVIIAVLNAIGVFGRNEPTPEQLVRTAVVGQNDGLQRKDYARFQTYTCKAQAGTEADVLAKQEDSAAKNGQRYVDEVRDIKSEMAAMGCVYDRTFDAKQKAWGQLGLPWPDPEVAAPYRQRPKVNWEGEGLGDRLDEFAASLATLPEPNPFSSCNIEKRLEMVKLMEQRKFLAGERIVTFGETCDEFFLVVDGGVQTRAPSAHLDAACPKPSRRALPKTRSPTRSSSRSRSGTRSC